MFGAEKHRLYYINHYNEQINDCERAMKKGPLFERKLE